jgi:TldD protein
MNEKAKLTRVLEKALQQGAEFAELFLEDREETNIPYQAGRVQGVKSLRIYGAGLHLINGTQRVYVYTNDTSEESLMKLTAKACEMLEAKVKYSGIAPVLTEKEYHNPCPIEIYPGAAADAEKVRMLLLAEKAIHGAGPAVRSLSMNYYDTDQRVTIANTEGVYTHDRRVTTRLRYSPLVENEKGSYAGFGEFTRAQGFEAFREEEAFVDSVKDAVWKADRYLRADTVKPCVVPVVLAAGNCGTLWHESCGHSLEAVAIAAGSSAFAGKIGERVASEKVTLIDDGTLTGQYGSGAIDDEGHPRQRNVLIENGILKGYLCDRYHGKLIGMESTGSGRRQNYTYAPAARMTNTLLSEGTDDEEEIIRSVDNGLYVQTIGGGYGGSQFSLVVQEGFWIKDGKLDRQVKNLMLTGSGIDVIKRIDRVGKHLELESGAFCGAGSGLVPTTTPQPMCRISAMSVG